jgi:hypothetical protein
MHCQSGLTFTRSKAGTIMEKLNFTPFKIKLKSQLRVAGVVIVVLFIGAGCNTSATHSISQLSSSQALPNRSDPTAPMLTEQYSSGHYHYSVKYDANWELTENDRGSTSFYLTKDGPVFSIGVNTYGYGIPTIAYYGVLKGQQFRPLHTLTFKDNENVCAIRDDRNVYIQRDDVVYSLSASESNDFGDPKGLSADQQADFEAFILSFTFLEPWSNRGAPPITPPIPVPCWR